MRITVELDPKTVKTLLAVTGERKKGPAIAKAAREYLRRQKLIRFGDSIRRNVFDFDLSNQEIEELEK